MKYPRRKTLIALAFAVLLSACATKPIPEVPAGKFGVAYSLVFADGTQLKQKQDVVSLVTRETTGRAVGAAVALNVVLLAFGGLAYTPVDKDKLKGRPINDAADPKNVRNPVATDFVAALQTAVDARIAAEPAWHSRSFRRPITVGGGWVSLVYESLLGEAEPPYQLKLDLDVYKHAETGMFSPTQRVECSARSEPAQELSAWSANSYLAVKKQLDLFLANCQEKVLAELPRLLSK